MDDIPTNLPPLSGPLVVALVYDGLCTFEFAITAEIFGLSRPELGPGWYRFAAAAIEPGPLRAQGGLRLTVDGGLELLDQADLIIVPGWKGAGVPVPPWLTDRLRAAHGRGCRLASICSGAFVLAATGLLDGKRLTTHWRYADILRQTYPAVRMDGDVLYVQEGRLFTSAGSAAGMDLMLHIIRSDFGHDVANNVARRLVVPAHRRGGQAQFIPRPVPRQPQSRLSPLLDRIRGDLETQWTVASMAQAAAMGERTFLRRFREATGQSPATWLALERVEAAKHLLETTDLSVEEVARLAGFGAPPALRHHFTRTTGLAPRDYRERFGEGPAVRTAARSPG